MLDAFRAADHSAKDENVAAIEGQDSVVEDVPGDASGRAAVSELERSCIDRGSAKVGIVSG